MSERVVIEKYNPEWPAHFDEIKAHLWPALKDFAVAIEHVGSTSVPGLAAKPIIDIDIVIPDSSSLDKAIQALAELGYEHRGNLGIKDRDAFRPKIANHRHNLYVCPRESVALRNHLCLRNTLRSNAKLRDEYASVKYKLAFDNPESIDDYVEGKTIFIMGILSAHGYGSDELEEIRRANLAPANKIKI